ncbi:MAG: TMEM165/GDT1 family protein [Candidatus Micrarchaeota archaeon]
MLELLEVGILAFALNFFAELGDKTQLAVLALSSKYPDKKNVFLGSFLGLALAVAVSVLLGGAVSQLIPPQTIKAVAGIAFVLFGAYTFFARENEKESELKNNKTPFISSFILLFLMEMGDKTQLANFFLGASYSALAVFLGAVLALGLLTALAVVSGAEISKRIDPSTVRMVSALLFVLAGVSALAGL